VELLSNILISVMIAATPLVLAATGELVAERAGVLNLGVEGMMVLGALAAFAVMIKTGSHLAAVLAAPIAGVGLAALFGLISLSLRANQVAAGLALTMFGLGISALWGQGLSGLTAPPLPRLQIAGLSDLTWLGKLLFAQDALIYLSLALVAAVAFILERTRVGLILRAIGENPEAAHAIGHPVIVYRYCATLFGGALAGLGGAYLSLVQTPLWAERMTAGRGWIALALVVFAAWRPWRVLGGAYLFGAVTILQLHSQALGIKIDAQVLSMLPYLVTILVLVMISRDRMRMQLTAPAALGKPFHAAA
jgi:ABC-type uncharacterized transport system permease subunit